MKRIKVLLLFCFLLDSAQCRPTGRGASVLFTYFDDTVQQAIHLSLKLDFRECIHSIYKSWHKWYTTCLVTSVQEWTNMNITSMFPNMCGNIGYMKTHPISLEWTIKTLHSSVGILLNVTYMDLPFGGGRCQFGHITINSNMYCGRRLNWAICMDSKITIRLEQGIALLPGMGFVAMYSAMMCRVKPDTVHRLFEEDGSWVNDTQLTYDYYKQDVVSQYIWHILVTQNKLIEFKVKADNDPNCKIYDGPGPLSPVLYNSTRSSAYHLYIVKQNPNIVLKYSSVAHTSFSTDKSIMQSSVVGKNIVHAYMVKGGTFGLRINFLSIHSHNIVSEFPMRCLVGGLFLYSYRYNNTVEIPICDTDWKEEMFFHLTDKMVYSNDAHYNIFIILYDGYTRGKVALSVESVEPCYIVSDKGRVLRGCQNLYLLTPDDQLDWSQDFPNAGPIYLTIHMVPTIYDLYNFRLNISVMDSHIFGLNNTIHTHIVGTRISISYQNPTSFSIKEIHGHQFTTWRVVLIKFKRMAVCDYRHVNQHSHYLKGTQSFTMQPMFSGCQCIVVGYLQYSVVIIAPDTNINVALQFSDYCESECHMGNITAMEYNHQYDRLVVHRFKYFPVRWDNIHSLNSVMINISVTDNCKRCPLWIVSMPGWQDTWFEAVKLSSNIKKSKAFLPVKYPTR